MDFKIFLNYNNYFIFFIILYYIGFLYMERKEKEVKINITINDIKRIFINSVKSEYKIDKLNTVFDEISRDQNLKKKFETSKDIEKLEYKYYYSLFRLAVDSNLSMKVIHQKWDTFVKPEIEKLFKPNKITIDDVKKIFYKQFNNDEKRIDKAWKFSEPHIIKTLNRDNSFFEYLLVDFVNFYSNIVSDATTEDIEDEWYKIVLPQFKELIGQIKITDEELKQYTINILKKVNNDYAKIVIYLLENNKIEDIRSIDHLLLENANLDIDVVIELSKYWITKNPNNIEMLSNFLSSNKGIKVKDIEKHPEIKWNYDLLSENPNMTWDFIFNTLYKNVTNSAVMYYLYEQKWKNPDLTDKEIYAQYNEIENTKEVKKYELLEKKYWRHHIFGTSNTWDFKKLSSNPNIPFEVIKELPFLWNYTLLSENTVITPQIIRDNPDIPWNYNYLMRNPNFKYDDLKEFVDNKIDFITNFCYNPNIRQIIKSLNEYINLDWESDQQKRGVWNIIPRNPGISIQDIIDNPQLPWNLGFINDNPNLTYKTIVDNIDYFDVDDLLSNELDGKYKKDVKFPEYYRLIYYLYQYIVAITKEEKEIYDLSKRLFENINRDVNSIISTNEIPPEIKRYNKILKLPSYDIFGIIQHHLVSIMRFYIRQHINTNIEIRIEIPNLLIVLSNFSSVYKQLGGIEIVKETRKLDKKECGVDIEYFTQKNLQGRDEGFEKEEDKKEFDVNELISFELNGKVMCLKRSELISFWNSDPDEEGKYLSWNWGDCIFHPDGRPYEDTCKRFFKIPIQTYISEKTKRRIEEGVNVNYWKLEKEKVVRMGKNLHRISEYNNPSEQIYKAVPVISYRKR
jgi:hypothetical protein